MRLLAESLTIERGGRRLLTDLSFALDAGEALQVTGRNGAGKSTLLRVVAGLAPAHSGRIMLEDPAADAGGSAVAMRCHYLGHADSLKSALTSAENLEFWRALLSGGEPALSPAMALARFGLAHVADLPVRYLSAGQKRRVALARLLVAWRPLWLVDEPTTALDRPSRQRFAEVLRDHLDRGGLVLAATHVDLGLAGTRELALGEA